MKKEQAPTSILLIMNAQMCYNDAVKEGVEVAELWYCPNPYEIGQNRYGRLMTSFEKEN